MQSLVSRGGIARVQILLNTLYLTMSGYLHLDNDTLRFEVKRETRMRVPLHHIGSVVCFDNVLVSPAAMSRLAEEGKTLVFLDQCAGLVAIKSRHHDVAKDDFGLVVSDFCERIKSVFGKQYPASSLHEKNLGTPPNRVAVVDDHHFDATQVCSVSQFLPPASLRFVPFLGL